MTPRKGWPPARCTRSAGGPAGSGADLDPAASAEKLGEAGRRAGRRHVMKRPETRILRLPLNTGLHVSGPPSLPRGLWTRGRRGE